MGQRHARDGRCEERRAKALSADTIYAPATAPGRAGLAVLRISGPNALQAAQQIARTNPDEPRKAYLTGFYDRYGALIDRGILLWFKAPASFTGEDVVEFQLHGGRAIMDAVLDACAHIAGLRAAERGEFTRRAVENAKLDLTQAEALADLIDADTAAQRGQALQQLDGALRDLYEDWRNRLIRTAALAEAAIDFPDEEIPEGTLERVRADIRELGIEIDRHLTDSRRGEIVRDGVYLTLFGKPNSGKSSLLNALAKRDVAIVSERAGTTRDVLEVRLDLDGYPVILVDTAGIRDTVDTIEVEGVRRALARIETADIKLLLLDATAADPTDDLPAGMLDTADMVVWNKVDIASPPEDRRLAISAQTGKGLAPLLAAISELCSNSLESNGNGAPLTRARHRELLTVATSCIRRAESAPANELLGEDLRLAMRAIGQITGSVGVEEILDVIFREFCIGK
jgi:tRNA modification GTPase